MRNASHVFVVRCALSLCKRRLLWSCVWFVRTHSMEVSRSSPGVCSEKSCFVNTSMTRLRFANAWHVRETQCHSVICEAVCPNAAGTCSNTYLCGTVGARHRRWDSKYLQMVRCHWKPVQRVESTSRFTVRVLQPTQHRR